MLTRRSFTFPALSIAAAGLAGCGSRSIVALPEIGSAPKGLTTRTLARPNYAEVYTEYPGERFPIMAIDYQRIDSRYLRQTVEFPRDDKPGSIVVDPAGYHLYFVESPRVATRYGVGVGREGFGWSGAARINMKRDWADWVPPPEMIARDPAIRAQLEQTRAGSACAAARKARSARARSTSSARAAISATAFTAHSSPTRSAPTSHQAASG